jgi:hypothetical protein
VKLENIVPSSVCMVGTTNSVVELVALSKATTLAACRCQPMHFTMLVVWYGYPLGVRISSDSLMEWIIRIISKNLYVESSQTQ